MPFHSKLFLIIVQSMFCTVHKCDEVIFVCVAIFLIFIVLILAIKHRM